MSIQSLSNEKLVECYYEAFNLDLEPDFIELIFDEITRRGLSLEKLSNVE